ncbi:phospholipase A and acyltransferase 4-like [Micropterus dolomieu]|uniref:phospholipase A and acyltransferase 4-like n=1 Tax=Micropterus dolomieu TaxID=147949 RepID=UPI001E8CE1CC|nr:phospholipase A and acyltransferase 4-like [Micropterus dolomieu]
MAPTMFDNGAKPGDLIEIFRGAYEHWAIYIGGNEVVHLIPPSDDDSGPFGSRLMVLDSNKAYVRRQKIWEVVGSDRFHINNLLDDEYQPRERHVIVRDACRSVGQLLSYSVATYNCEHFVTELRYGKPESRQVKTAAVIGGVAAGIGIVALGAVLFSLLKDDDKRRHHK